MVARRSRDTRTARSAGSFAAPLLTLVLALACCLDGRTSRPLGGRCSTDGDCGDGLVCGYGRCRSPCHFDRDCPEGTACVAVPEEPDQRVCSLADESGEEGALAGLVWSEGRFWNPCDPEEEDPCGADRHCDADSGLCVEDDPTGGDGDADTDTDTDADADADAGADGGFAADLGPFLWRAFNDTASFTVDPRVTSYSGYLDGGGGFEDQSGPLVDFDRGEALPVTATLTAVNVATGVGRMPAAGTPAFEVFDGIVSLDTSASYSMAGAEWSYRVRFEGLDPGGRYTFVTTADRGNPAYDGDGAESRWTAFSLVGARASLPASTAGVERATPTVHRMNTGFNTERGDVVAWTDIAPAADGTFTVRSDSVGPIGLGDAARSYGIQAFLLAEEAD